MIVGELKEAITHTEYSVEKTIEHLHNMKNVLSSGYSSAKTLSSIKWVIKKGIINLSKYIKQKILGAYKMEDKAYHAEIELMEKEHDSMLD